jgi:hypothetical protein
MKVFIPTGHISSTLSWMYWSTIYVTGHPRKWTGLGLSALGFNIDTNLRIRTNWHLPSITHILDRLPPQSCTLPDMITLSKCFLHITAHDLLTRPSLLSELALYKSVTEPTLQHFNCIEGMNWSYWGSIEQNCMVFGLQRNNGKGKWAKVGTSNT